MSAPNERRQKRLFATIVAVCLTPVVLIYAWGAVQEAQVAQELAEARKLGLATNAAEIRAMIEPAKPEENAAPIYGSLRPKITGIGDLQKLSIEQFETESAFIEAKKLLRDRHDAYRMVDEATSLPRCWFNRPWEKGAAVLFPELANMKSAARLLALRGALAAREGRKEEALGQVDSILIVAGHLREEPNVIASSVSQAVEGVAMDSLALWALKTRDPFYADALERYVKSLNPPDLKRELAADLPTWLSFIDLWNDSKLRSDLGLKEADYGWEHRFRALVANKKAAKINVIRSMRELVQAADAPYTERVRIFDRSYDNLHASMEPFLGPILDLFVGSDAFMLATFRKEGWEAKRLQYLAVARIVKQGKAPDLSDLKSPFDGGPVSATFDGKEITVTVSGYEDRTTGKPHVLNVPPKP